MTVAAAWTKIGSEAATVTRDSHSSLKPKQIRIYFFTWTIWFLSAYLRVNPEQAGVSKSSGSRCDSTANCCSVDVAIFSSGWYAQQINFSIAKKINVRWMSELPSS
jgi:hypothetical protein